MNYDYHSKGEVILSDDVLGTYIIRNGQMLRRRPRHEQERYEESKRETALREANRFLDDRLTRLGIEIGDIVNCTHVHATHGFQGPAPVRLCDRHKRGSVDVQRVPSEGREAFSKSLIQGLSSSTISDLVKKENRSIEELLTSDDEVDRKIGKARIRYRKLYARIKKMNKEQRIKTFMTKWADPIYETHESAGIEGMMYSQGWADGYNAALRELEGGFYDE